MNRLSFWRAGGVSLFLLASILLRATSPAHAENGQPAAAEMQEMKRLFDLAAEARGHNEIDKALDLYQQAGRVAHKAGHRKGEGLALFWQGQVYRVSNRFDEAQEQYAAALPIFRQIDDASAEATTLRLLSFVALHRKHLDEAKIYARRALFVSRLIKDSENEGRVLWLMASIAKAGDDLRGAAQQFEQAALVLHEIKDDDELDLLTELAQLLAPFDVKGALGAYQRVADLAAERKDVSRQATALFTMGIIAHENAHDSRASLSYYDQALALAPGNPMVRQNRLESVLAVGGFAAVLAESELLLKEHASVIARSCVLSIGWTAAVLLAREAEAHSFAQRLAKEYATAAVGTQFGWVFNGSRHALLAMSQLRPAARNRIFALWEILEKPVAPTSYRELSRILNLAEPATP